MTITAPDPDWTLVAQARTDSEAFADLYRAHRGAVYAYVLRRVRQHELAEDLTADVFVRALGHLDRVQDTGHAFAAWLLTIARNIVFDHWKRQSTQREVSVDEVPEVHIPHQRMATDGVDAEIMLRGCLATLTAGEQALLVDRFLHGLRPTEMAARDGRTVNAVKTAQHRALQRARAHAAAGWVRSAA